MAQMIYVVEDVTTTGVYDLFYSFSESSAEMYALWHRNSQLTRAEAMKTDTQILGWEIETECGDPHKAFNEWLDEELESQGFLRDADYWKEII